MGGFLSSPESLYVLNDSPTGWTSEAARQAVGIGQYEHDPADPHWGFTSWNDFFTRRFRDGQRPVAAPDDDKVIVSACESTPYNLRTDVQQRDQFWIKDEPYSLQDLLCNDPSVPEFVGGTVYQAFLSATNYHRWHSPVAGTVLRAYLVDGTYYSEGDADGTDAQQETSAQTYLAHVAARAVVIIDADDPVIGLLAFVAVGMSEVSSCLFAPDIAPGHHLAKGEELGHFRFGGSTLPGLPPGRHRRVQPLSPPATARPESPARQRPIKDRDREPHADELEAQRVPSPGSPLQLQRPRGRQDAGSPLLPAGSAEDAARPGAERRPAAAPQGHASGACVHAATSPRRTVALCPWSS